jgi:hypothetical protein
MSLLHILKPETRHLVSQGSSAPLQRLQKGNQRLDVFASQ